ncbi:MAG: DUF2997 domain-containing protein [Desulfobacterales bacterium]|nr:DUF2997 domain-containing protein [Desulfobacterales bacterium]
MAKRTEIEVEIDEQGDVKIEVKGIKGKACLDYADIFQNVLGPIKEQRLTSEYYEQSSNILSQIRRKVGF